MDQYIGKLLDNRYEILERIGIGGMAVVFKGRDHRLNRLVAIKILKEELAQDAEFRRRFHDESQAVAMLSHPNIMAVYDVSHTPELDYIVMELLDGITLKQYMQKKGGKLAWREALHFITQIMKALSHAHSRGIIHRDIKPHNVMVLRDGSLKVADFGIARLTSAAQATLTQEALGSVHYISPEQARGSHIDARSDIYSAGVVLYEMITGRLPYEGDSPVAVAIQHINSIPLSPREIDPEIPEALEAITMKAMASDVNQRYISADAMLADLEEFRKNPSINFDYTSADLLVNDGEEPTQVLGANTPHSVRPQPAHNAKYGQEAPEPQHQKRPRRPEREEPYDDYADRGSRLPIILAIIAVVVFLVGISVFLFVSFFSGLGITGTPTYSVPNLYNKTVEEALALDEVIEAQFQIVQGDTVASDLPAGHIVSQTPKHGLNASPGTTITVEVSDGSQSSQAGDTMPDVENLDYRIAMDRLEKLGFSKAAGNLVLEEQNSDDVNEDYVISQDPAPETPLDQVEQVKLVVSLGKKTEMVTVITFVGMPEDEARQKAEENLELVVSSVTEEFSEMEAGLITWQSIENGTSVAKGSSIQFRVSKGPDPNATAEPSTEPSAEPSPSPVSTPESGVTENTISVEVDLPRDGRESVSVVITVDGQQQYSDTVETKMQKVLIPLTASGTRTVTVYIDGQESWTRPINFN
ncbi:Stk1 family PASTA domain-containing Ser/Thr kinase [uncultured Flavonifractor sp.]|uniref:Stk1 family PASTA domain-containing Ser/Thr kinase n=1 Tax=uncultured Flavonifractor sp. TaxID=1193534 RepID=UPI0026185F8E|nr:Stk1 family PASTA domain-containing Ser/Thr kinase [uncultured Flavonifractor sp.]